MGMYEVPCPCERGEFEAPLLTLDAVCKKCAHPLSQHEDASSTPVPDSFLLPQGMSSFIHSLHFSHVFRRVNEHVLVPVDALRCPREATVAALWDQLKTHQVVHVRGTPTSGKSTLAQLLKDYVKRTSPNTKIYAFSWQRPDVLEKKGINGALYYRLLNFYTERPLDTDDWLNMRNMLLIIDEAQVSYQYDNLWTDFIKRIASDGDEGRRVILFSSYGSPAQIPLVHGPVESPSMELSANQRVSIRSLSDNNQKISLYFTRLEFDDVVARACKRSGEYVQPFHLSPESLDYIWEFSNGHPAGTRLVLDALINSEVSVYSLYHHLYF
jgi:hypothetical protein